MDAKPAATWGVGLLIAALVFTAYWPALRGEFVWDDDAYFTYNRIEQPDGLRHIWLTSDCADYWPVTSTSLWLEWRLWGPRTRGYHVTNLLLHAGEAWLLWAILRRLNVPGGLVAALLFALHPVNVESVAWIAERKNLMAMLFFLLTVYCFLRSDVCRQALSRRWYALSLLAFLLALLSKASVATAPLVLAGLIVWHRPWRRHDAWLLLPFFAAAGALVEVNLWFREHGYSEVVRRASTGVRLAGSGDVIWFYLAKALAPFRQILVYPQWNIRADGMAAWLPLAAAAGAACYVARLWRSRYRAFSAAGAYFIVMLVPVMGLTDVYFMRYSLVADHYEHLALVGLVALAGAGWAIWRRNGGGWMAVAAAGAVVALFGFRSRAQAETFRDAETLYRATLAENPDCWLAHNNLGMIWAQRGRLEEAVGEFRTALRLNPEFAQAHSNMGTVLSHYGHLPEAIAEYREAVRLDPTLPDAHSGLGNSLVDMGDLRGGLGQLQQALRLEPDFPEAHNGLGNLFVRAGRIPDAIRQYEEALRLRPNFPEAENNLGVALDRAGRLSEAIAQLQAAVRFNPGYADAHANLAVLLRKAGRPREAAEQEAVAARLRQLSL